MRCVFVFELGKELGWLEKWVYRDPETVVEKLGDYSCKQGAADLQARVSVRFNKEYLEVLIYHEVIAKDLEAVRDALWVKLKLKPPSPIVGAFDSI